MDEYLPYIGISVVILIVILIVILLLKSNGNKSSGLRPVRVEFNTPREVKNHMIEGNELYRTAKKNNADISYARRKDTTEHGQFPYAVVITCSDSRVPPEHIFTAGVGELFVIRTAGNVIGDLELGSIEYAAAHLHSKVILVLGHENCGAIAATLGGYAEGNIQSIINEIAMGIGNTKSAREAEILNVEHGIDRIHSSEVIQELLRENKVTIEGAIYRISDGSVRFLDR
ncbi:MAG: carbonic anhydrase [Eubacteriales bacterium]